MDDQAVQSTEEGRAVSISEGRVPSVENDRSAPAPSETSESTTKWRRVHPLVTRLAVITVYTGMVCIVTWGLTYATLHAPVVPLVNSSYS